MTMPTLTRLAIASFAAGLVATACSSETNENKDTTDGGISGTITVLAAASLTETFTKIKSQFEDEHPGTTIEFSFGASSDLATQIEQGSPGDVFASASTKTMDQIGDTALAATNFATNTMEIATPPGNPAGITSIADLAKGDVKVAVCDFEVPCGTVAKQVFDNAKIAVDPTANEQDVKSTLAVVESGEVDAGVVYVTDVAAAGDKVDGVEIPDDTNATTTYPISVLKDAGNTDLALAFVDYVLSDAGQQVLQDAAFAPA